MLPGKNWLKISNETFWVIFKQCDQRVDIYWSDVDLFDGLCGWSDRKLRGLTEVAELLGVPRETRKLEFELEVNSNCFSWWSWSSEE